MSLICLLRAVWLTVQEDRLMRTILNSRVPHSPLLYIDNLSQLNNQTCEREIINGVSLHVHSLWLCVSMYYTLGIFCLT